jgi:hypothetical protein
MRIMTSQVFADSKGGGGTLARGAYQLLRAA